MKFDSMPPSGSEPCWGIDGCKMKHFFKIKASLTLKKVIFFFASTFPFCQNVDILLHNLNPITIV